MTSESGSFVDQVVAREYGPGLGYGPTVTAVLATVVVVGCALVVLGWLAVRLHWWRTDRQERRDDDPPES